MARRKQNASNPSATLNKAAAAVVSGDGNG
jgi:hypothetical protein